MDYGDEKQQEIISKLAETIIALGFPVVRETVSDHSKCSKNFQGACKTCVETAGRIIKIDAVRFIVDIREQVNKFNESTGKYLVRWNSGDYYDSRIVGMDVPKKKEFDYALAAKRIMAIVTPQIEAARAEEVQAKIQEEQRQAMEALRHKYPDVTISDHYGANVGLSLRSGLTFEKRLKKMEAIAKVLTDYLQSTEDGPGPRRRTMEEAYDAAESDVAIRALENKSTDEIE